MQQQQQQQAWPPQQDSRGARSPGIDYQQRLQQVRRGSRSGVAFSAPFETSDRTAPRTYFSAHPRLCRSKPSPQPYREISSQRKVSSSLHVAADRHSSAPVSATHSALRPVPRAAEALKKSQAEARPLTRRPSCPHSAPQPLSAAPLQIAQRLSEPTHPHSPPPGTRRPRGRQHGVQAGRGGDRSDPRTPRGGAEIVQAGCDQRAAAARHNTWKPNRLVQAHPHALSSTILACLPRGVGFIVLAETRPLSRPP